MELPEPVARPPPKITLPVKPPIDDTPDVIAPASCCGVTFANCPVELSSKSRLSPVGLGDGFDGKLAIVKLCVAAVAEAGLPTSVAPGALANDEPVTRPHVGTPVLLAT